MQFLGIGPLEFLFIVVIAILVLGPKGMVQTAREAGKFIRKIVRSPLWKDVVDTSREIREFPRKIVREAGIEKEIDELRRSTQGTFDDLSRIHKPDVSPMIEENEQEIPDKEKLKENENRESEGLDEVN